MITKSALETAKDWCEKFIETPSESHHVAPLAALIEADRATLLALMRKYEVALGELHAMVWGECPSLLNEDSGGCARLDLDIRALLPTPEEVAGQGRGFGPVSKGSDQ